MIELNDLVAYHKEFRTSLFVSGITIGSFLFSMKTFILKTMRDDFYDNQEYQSRVRERRGLGQMIGFYDPLKNLSRLLLASIVMSFISAISQISIGYLSCPLTVILCLLLALISWAFVASSIYFVSKNWSAALDLAETKAQKAAEDASKSQLGP